MKTDTDFWRASWVGLSVLLCGLCHPLTGADADVVTELDTRRIFVHDMAALPEATVRNIATVDWCAKSNVLLFDKRGLNQYYNVSSMTPEGFRLSALTLDRNRGVTQLHNYCATWHPGGKYFIFSGQNAGSTDYRRSGPGTGWHCNLWLAKSDGSQFWQLTSLPTRYNNPAGATMPSFSADGKKVFWTAFTGKEATRTAYDQRSLCLGDFRMTDAGPVLENEQTFQPGRRHDFYESYGFSPDGSRILFSANMNEDQPWYCMDICIIDRNESEPRILYPNAGGWDRYASFSPDGRKIIWSSSRTFNIPFLGPGGTDWERYLRSELWIMDNDGANAKQLTFFNTPTAKEFNGRRAIVGDVAWSPDGKRVAVVLHRETRNFDVVSNIMLVTLGQDEPGRRPSVRPQKGPEKPADAPGKPDPKAVAPGVPKW